ncbi:hypothetical protein [Burkholderia gladioli]|uniref:hypothetical protein n=1 Tax=Burkholderia gladioli TaxID=28095 RepID=UPI001640F12C|nr:hypothetical protein [Burkholderia gladioli]
MMTKLKATQAFALSLNLLGTILFAWSFQATSSDFRLVTTKNYTSPDSNYILSTAYAICVNNYALAVTDSTNGILLGARNCPDWQHARPAAVVTSEHPLAFLLGLYVTMAGFLIQLLLVADWKPLRWLIGDPTQEHGQAHQKTPPPMNVASSPTGKSKRPNLPKRRR